MLHAPPRHHPCNNPKQGKLPSKCLVKGNGNKDGLGIFRGFTGKEHFYSNLINVI